MVRYALNANDIRALQEFLENPARPSGTLTYCELCGFVFTVAAAPDLVPISEWLPLVFDEQDPGYSNQAEAEEVIQGIVTLYNHLNEQVNDRSSALPPGVAFRADLLANFEYDAAISQWARGFAFGCEWLEESWPEPLPDDISNELGACLMTLSFFSSREIAERFARESTVAPAQSSLERFAVVMRKSFPDALRSYAHLGRTIYDVRMQIDAEGGGQKIPAIAVGRNEPCPCGSGKKFKKCCGLK